VIWTAYLCMLVSRPSISAPTVTSWAKFLGTPPPIISRPLSFDAILMRTSSRKSLAESIETWESGLCHWWCRRPKPAEQSEKAGTKIGTPFL